MEWLKSIDPIQVQAWIALLVVIVGLVEAALRKRKEAALLDEKDKRKFYWDAMRDLAPKAMHVVRRGVRLTKSEKGDQFLEVMERLARAVGIGILEEDHDAIKDLGTAEHEKLKHNCVMTIGAEYTEVPDENEGSDTL